MKTGFYWKTVAPLKAGLVAAVGREELRELHRRVWWRHFLVLLRQVALLLAAAYGALWLENPFFWLPLSVYIGFTAFNFTVLLHEAVHLTIFERSHPFLDAVMGQLYALPSGISRSQFTRWHLDHHNELGTGDRDPKRHWLTPKVVRRWYKLLYCTPALFPIYFRAAAREAATYPESLRARIRRERLVTTAVHVAAMAALVVFLGALAFVKLYAVPYFLVFPVAFTLNRLGQHYNIDPTSPLKWGTLMKPSRLWDFLFLYSNYHLEHHYFPTVPFYNLRTLHFRLRDFYRAHGIRPHTYREILWGWFVENHVPHTNWSEARPGDAGVTRPSSVAAR